MRSLYPTPNCFLMPSGLSKARSLPLVIMHILSASSSASSKCWELMMIERPTLSYLMSSHVYLLDSTSSPEVGSSRIITFGFVTIAIASESLRFMPPESSETYLLWCSVSMTTYRVFSISPLISALGTFLSSQTNCRCSMTVSISKRTSNCWQRPRFYWTWSMLLQMLWP